MKQTFKKQFQDFGECDVYIGAVNSGKKSIKDCQLVSELLEAVDEKRFGGKEGELIQANLVRDGKLITCIFAGFGDKTTYKSVESAFGSAMKEAKKPKQSNNPNKSNEPIIRPNSGEFLSGFWKSDRLIPSLTVTIYFGVDEWDAPLSLFDMMEIKDPRILSCLDNYHVHLIAPAHMAYEDILKFQSNLREVLLFIKYSKDKKKLHKILEQNQARFREVERRAVDVIEAITHMSLEYKESEGKIDMCQAIKEMREESLQEGLLRGRREGKIEAAKNFYRLGIDIEKIAEGVGSNLETVKSWLGLEAEKQP